MIYYEKKVYTAMVNNSIDINKTNKHLSPQIIERKKTMTYCDRRITDIGDLEISFVLFNIS